jgi:hypothetical protein
LSAWDKASFSPAEASAFEVLQSRDLFDRSPPFIERDGEPTQTFESVKRVTEKSRNFLHPIFTGGDSKISHLAQPWLTRLIQRDAGTFARLKGGQDTLESAAEAEASRGPAVPGDLAIAHRPLSGGAWKVANQSQGSSISMRKIEKSFGTRGNAGVFEVFSGVFSIGR